MDQDGPSDLSLKGDSIHDSESNRYKFKSNIQKRFSQQDPSIGGSSGGNNHGDWLSSSREVSSAKQPHNSSAGNSRGGIEQSPDLENVGGESDRVRIASDGSAFGGGNSGAGVGERYPNLSLDCDMKSRMVDGMDSECQHSRQKQSPENIAPLSSQQAYSCFISCFAKFQFRKSFLQFPTTEAHLPFPPISSLWG